MPLESQIGSITSILESSHAAGHWGDWGSIVYCDVNHYVVGYRMKIAGSGGDDSALNGVELRCAGYGSSTTSNIITSTVGP